MKITLKLYEDSCFWNASIDVWFPVPFWKKGYKDIPGASLIFITTLFSGEVYTISNMASKW